MHSAQTTGGAAAVWAVLNGYPSNPSGDAVMVMPDDGDLLLVRAGNEQQRQEVDMKDVHDFSIMSLWDMMALHRHANSVKG